MDPYKKHIKKPVKHLRWSVLRKYLKAFRPQNASSQIFDLVLNRSLLLTLFIEAVVQRCSVRKVFSKISQNSQENTCARVSFLIKLQRDFANKETLAPVFSCEFCEISKSIFFTEHLWATASQNDTP